MSILHRRLTKELTDLERDPPTGIVCYPLDDDMTKLESCPPDSPYQNGLFQLAITIPAQYPFDPPQIQFKTPIYHPNIDDCGRICADILKKGTKGGWKPSLNLPTTLMALSTLLACPNPDDPLDADIAKEYKLDYDTFRQKAIDYTQKHATESQSKKTLSLSADCEEEKSSPKTTQKEAELDSTDNAEAVSPSKTSSKLSLSKKKQKAQQSPMPSPVTPKATEKAAHNTTKYEEIESKGYVPLTRASAKRENTLESPLRDAVKEKFVPHTEDEGAAESENDDLLIVPSQKKRRILSLSKHKKQKEI